MIKLNEVMKKDANLYIKSPLNYTGNKYRILPQILPHFPKKIGTMVDMFCGGATVGINVDADKVIFVDNNPRVISLLKFLAMSNFDRLMFGFARIIGKYKLSASFLDGYECYFKQATPKNKNNGLKEFNKNGFYKLRDDYNKIQDKDSPKANLMLYILLVYGFNNDLRFNSEGNYNLPCGKTDLNKNNIKKVEEFVKKSHEKEFEFICGDFTDKKIQEIIYKADFVYFDPPYLITDAVYNETSGWNVETENKLLSLLTNLKKKKVPFVLSNVLEKPGANTINEPLKKWFESTGGLKLVDIDYHYRSSSYNKKNRDSKEREIIICSK